MTDIEIDLDLLFAMATEIDPGHRQCEALEVSAEQIVAITGVRQMVYRTPSRQAGPEMEWT